MTISNEMKERIEMAMAGLSRDEYLRLDRSYNEFVREMGQLIAQAKQDEAALAAAGMDFGEMAYYDGLFEMLSMEHAVRVNAVVSVSEEKAEYTDAIDQARRDNAALMAVGRYVLARSEKTDAKRVYNQVRKGTGDLNMLGDNLSMVSFVRRFSELASQVRPGGEALTEDRLMQIETEACRLIKLKGEATVSSDGGSAAVDRQQRLLTLCLQARNEIKLFAEMAFFDDTERYNRDYAITARRTARADDEAATIEDALAAEEILAAAEEVSATTETAAAV